MLKPLATLIILLILSLQIQAQPKPIHHKSLLIGWLQRVENPNPLYPDNQLPNWQTNFRVPTLGFEASFGKWASFQMSAGTNLFGPHKNASFKKFNTHFEGELRYYFMLRQNRSMNGFYFGLYGDVNRIRWKYRDSNQLAVRTSWEDAGPSFGYQHGLGLGRHLRFNEGVVAVIQSSVRTNEYDASGLQTRAAIVVDAWYAFYWYAKISFQF